MVSHMVFGFLCAVVIGVVAVAFTSWSNTPQVLEQNPSSSSRRSSEPRPKPNVRRRRNVHNEVCPVCLDDVDYEADDLSETCENLPCGHCLHLNCYQKCIQNQLGACPFCRESM